MDLFKVLYRINTFTRMKTRADKELYNAKREGKDRINQINQD